MAENSDHQSEQTKQHMIENSNFIYTIGKTYSPNPELSESSMGEAISYTIAVAANLKDGTIPDIDTYKEKLREAINDGLNNLIKSENVGASIENFNTTIQSLAECKESIMNTEHSKQFIDAIEAIENICKEKLNDVEKILDNDKGLSI
jgi:hypothetical protein